MSQADKLYHLQQVELHLGRTQKRLHDIVALLANNEQVKAAEQAVTTIKQQVSPLQAQAKNLELEIETNREKIKQTDEALYSGRVRNPKELQDMQHEIESLKRRNVVLEDQLLETMMQVEETEARLTEAEAILADATRQHEASNRDLIAERNQLRTEQPVLIEKRNQMIPTIDADSLQVYNAIKSRKANQPVALLVNQSCSFCRVEQDLSIVGEVRKGIKLTYCGSCGRILAYSSG